MCRDNYKYRNNKVFNRDLNKLVNKLEAQTISFNAKDLLKAKQALPINSLNKLTKRHIYYLVISKNSLNTSLKLNFK